MSRRNRVGSNQYKTKVRFSTKQKVGTYAFTALILMGVLNSLVPTSQADLISPIASQPAYLNPSVEVASVSARVVDPTKVDNAPEQISIERYIKTIFGLDAKVAIAVSHNECNPANKKYPKCELHTDVEDSIGVFQINIMSKVHHIHWDKIPGDTLEEKKESLQNPYINTLVAYRIFKDSGFEAWSAYTSQRYLRDM